jgi:hypothetical protein
LKENWTQLKKRPVKWVPDKIVFHVYEKSSILSVRGTSLLKRFDGFNYVDVYYRKDANQVSIKPQKNKTSNSYKIGRPSSGFFQISASRTKEILGIKETIELTHHWEGDMLILKRRIAPET